MGYYTVKRPGLISKKKRGGEEREYRRKGFFRVPNKTYQYNINTATPGVLFHQKFPGLVSAAGRSLDVMM